MKVDFGDYDTQDRDVWIIVSKSPVEGEIKCEVCFDLEEGVSKTPFYLNRSQLMRLVAGMLVISEQGEPT